MAGSETIPMPHDNATQTPLADLGRLIQSPFARMRTLLEGIEPGLSPIDMTIGEPRHGVPDFLAAALAERIPDYGKYPPIAGTPELVDAIAAWIGRRYPSLAGAIEPARHILPLTGSREGLFSVIFPAMARKAGLSGRPTVLMPNPFYQAYLAAAVAGGGEPVFLDAEEENGFLPDLNALNPDLLARTAVMYLATPANPQGAVASRDYLAKAITLARQYDFMLVIDECYSEVYFGARPTGGLETAHALTPGDFVNVLALNSLSKRSNVPGLRSGFIAGDAPFLADYSRFRNVACPQMALPVQHGSAVLWGEESHVEVSRARYAQKMEAAGRILGAHLGGRLPEGTFFLWLKTAHMGGGEAATKTFWKGCGVKVLPGAYLAQVDARGRNPGGPYVRIALVHDLGPTVNALERVAHLLS
jgi:N-succinyldiaminopimelate aminotransferase